MAETILKDLPEGAVIQQPEGGVLSELPEGAKVNQPGYLEDTGKAAVGGLQRGAVDALFAVPTLTDLGASAADWAANSKLGKAVLPEGAPEKVTQGANFVHDKVGPWTAGPMNKWTEQNVWGPTYQAQTKPGQYAQSVAEFLPSMAYGGGGAGARAVTALLGGMGAQAGGDAAQGLGLPEWSGRLAGGLVGGLAGPKLAKPAYVPPERAAQAQVLEKAGVPLTAGQTTGSPWMLQREANLMTPKRAQAEAGGFNQAVGNQSFMPGANKFDQPTLKGGFNQYQTANNQVAGATMQPGNFGQLQRDLLGIRRSAQGAVDQPTMGMIDQYIGKVLGGPVGGTGTAGGVMPGQFYKFMREDLQNQIQDAPHSAAQNYLGQIRGALDNAMGGEFAPGELKNINQTSRNFNVARKAVDESGNVTPEGIQKSMGGNSREYQSGSGLAPLAEAGSSVLQRPPVTEPGATTRALGTVAGLLSGRATGVPGESFVGGILGREIGSDIAKGMYRNPVTRGAYFNPATQYYLKNGVPGLNLMLPPEGVLSPGGTARALLGPTVGQIPNGSQ